MVLPMDWQFPELAEATPNCGKSAPMIPSCIMASFERKKSFASGLMYTITAASTSLPFFVRPDKRNKIAPSMRMGAALAAFIE